MTTTIGSAVTAYGQPVNSGQFTNINATTAGTLIKSGEGMLQSIIFSNPVATGVITIYDGLTTSGKVIGVITIPASPQPFTWGANSGGIFCATGIYIVVATAAQDLTVIFK